VRALVTGCAGFIGSHLVDALLAQGHEVVGVDDLSTGSMENLSGVTDNRDFHFYHGDYWSLVPLLAHGDVDVIFHQAAAKKLDSEENPYRDLHVNAKGTLMLLEHARGQGVPKFIYASTGSALNPTSHYGISKYAAESYVRLYHDLYGMDTTVLRYYHVIGPRQNDADATGGVAAVFVRRAKEGLPLIVHGRGEQERSFTDVRDVVAANLLVAEHPFSKGQTYTCASAINVSINELARYIADKYDVPIEYADERPGEVYQFDLDNKWLRVLGMDFNRDWRAVVDRL